MRSAIDPLFRCFLILMLATAVGCGSEDGEGDDDPIETVDAGIQPPDECNVSIVDPIDDDNCCPDGANATNDNDCAPVCGNGVLEGAEECDDGNTDPGDGCDGACASEVEATAFLEPPEYQASEAWLRQFEQERLDEELRLQRAIQPLTGATLTAAAVSRAARRILAIDSIVGLERDGNP